MCIFNRVLWTEKRIGGEGGGQKSLKKWDIIYVRSLIERAKVPFSALTTTHCYFTRLNLRKMDKSGYLKYSLCKLKKCFCLGFLWINRHQKQKEFLNSCEGFLRDALTEQGHPGPLWKIAKMALFDLCMEFEIFLGQMTSFEVLLKCHSLTLSKRCLRLHPAPSKCLSERIN